MRNIAFIGKARSGKDTAAAALVAEYAYTRVAFADPLKEMALRIDPIVDDGNAGYQFQFARLSEVVNAIGWERAKDEYPEVRRFLQGLGASVREHDEDFWLNIALRKIDGGAKLNMPVVVTDCRYPNEAEALRQRGFLMVRLVRPKAAMSGAQFREASAHASETALDNFPVDEVVHNISSLDALRSWVAALPFA